MTGGPPAEEGRGSAAAPRDWQHIQDVLNAALELPSGERSAFIAEASAGDPELEDEVRSLLAAHARTGVLDRPAADLATASFRIAPGSFPSPGHIAGRYEILDKLGVGGMGVVYRARDLRLDRIVALKFLSQHLGAEGAKERFVVEARAAAGLDHPNICTIHEIGETDEGHLFIAMPFYDGETLKQRLANGPLPAEQATDVAIQVAQGLACAHERGIVHRDIKPANVALTSGGVVKIVDFGVAKLADVSLTRPGMTPGTAAYMSPEQASGEDVDGRTDLWSLGVLLHEMLVGERPVGGVPGGVLPNASRGRDPPPMRGGGTQLSGALAQVVRRALASAREDRFPTAGDMVRALQAARPADRWQTAEELLAQLEGFATSTPGLRPTETVPETGREAPLRGAGARRWLAVGVPVAVAAVGVVVWLGPRGPAGPGDDGSAGDGLATLEAAEPDRLAVVPLENLTDDPDIDVWGQLAAEWMGNAIDRAGAIAVLPADAARKAVRTLGAEASATAVGERLRASHTLAGTLARTGNQVRFQVELLDVRSGERLVALEPVAGPVDSVEALVGRLADAAAAAAVARLDPEPSGRARLISLPVRLDVYRDGLRAEELFCQTRYEEAIEAGDRALAKDPEYVAALHLNGVSYAQSGRNEEADSVFSQLVPLRGRMTASERAMHDYQIAHLHGNASGAAWAIEEAYRIAPTVWGYIANIEMNQQRRHEEALVRLLSVDLDLPCNWPGWWTGAASTYHHLGRYEEELEVVRRGLERLRDHVGLMAVEAGALAATGRLEAVDSVLDRMAVLPSSPNFDTNMQPVWVGLELRAHGHPEAAEAAFERSLAAFRALPPDQDRYNRGTVLYYAGRWADADTLFAALVEESPRNVNYRGFRAATLARLGRRTEALEIDRWLAAVPERPGLRGSNRAWRARVAAILGERDAAVRHFRDALDHRFSYGVAVHRDPASDDMWGYPPWEALLASR